jgi:lysophospholipase L1-like esterase
MRQFSLFVLFVLCSQVQLKAQYNDFSTYYYQRLTLFEKLPDTPSEIIMLGNSITDGCEWSELLQNPNIKNRGISGDITEGVLYRLDEVTRSKPAKVFLLIGINDLARNIPADTVFQNICRIARNIQETSPSTEVYIQSILPVNPSFTKFGNHVSRTRDVMEINQKLNKWCVENSTGFIDLFYAFTEEDTNYLNPDFTNDGLHLTADGYYEWAEIISPFIKD